MARTTFIMPAYNAEAWIEGSVRSVLDQTDRDLRLFVVNDGSGSRSKPTSTCHTGSGSNLQSRSCFSISSLSCVLYPQRRSQ